MIRLGRVLSLAMMMGVWVSVCEKQFSFDGNRVAGRRARDFPALFFRGALAFVLHVVVESISNDVAKKSPCFRLGCWTRTGNCWIARLSYRSGCILTNVLGRTAIASELPKGRIVPPCSYRSIPSRCCVGLPGYGNVRCDDTTGARSGSDASAGVQCGGASGGRLRDLSAARHHIHSRSCRPYSPDRTASNDDGNRGRRWSGIRRLGRGSFCSGGKFPFAQRQG